jgi:hypothetical protein
MKRNHKHKIDYGLPDLYNHYKSNTKLNVVDKATYKKVLEDINKSLIKLIVLESLELSMPFKIGSISIRKIKRIPKLDKNGNLKKFYLPVDYKATKELWAKLYPDKTLEEIKQIPDRKRVYHTNNHTDGYTMSFKYFNKTSNLKNKSVYKFIPQRNSTRFLTETLKDFTVKTDYYERPY